mgnify:CR=1 FL=1
MVNPLTLPGFDELSRSLQQYVVGLSTNPTFGNVSDELLQTHLTNVIQSNLEAARQPGYYHGPPDANALFPGIPYVPPAPVAPSPAAGTQVAGPPAQAGFQPGQPGQTGTSQGNPFLGFLEEEPKTAYFSYANQFGGAPRSQRREKFFQNQFSDIYNQYLGRLGGQVRGGETPGLKWNDYLGGFDFNKWYQEQVPYEERNPQQGRFVPETKWRVGPRYQGNSQQGVFGG